jgi:IS1 family transposase
MPAQRLSKDKRAAILSILAEGTPINAVCRAFKTGKHAVLRLIEETGEALASYMTKEFRDLPCQRIEMDEQWQYVAKHGARMGWEEERGDFWLWAAIDADSKLVLSYHIGRRGTGDCSAFVEDVASRVSCPVQVTTDAYNVYAKPVRNFFVEGVDYATEHKRFQEEGFRPEKYGQSRKAGVEKVKIADRKAVLGNPDMSKATTAHIERFFLTMRQELTRFARLTLGYSKDLRMHKLAVDLHMGIYNLVRKHTTLGGATPAMAAGVEDRRWTMDDVVTMTEAYWTAKEEAAFEAAFAEAYKS